MRLLIAEDEEKLLKSLLHIMKINNYVADGVSDGESALEYALSAEYDGIILDIMMPKMDGVSVLKEIRKRGMATPVLFLTARTEVEQRVEGLDAGADDYLPKPFKTAELLARIRAMLRRKENYTPDMLSVGELTLNRSTYEIACGQLRRSLSAKEFQVLEMVMQKPNMIITIEQLITHIWGWDAEVDTSVVWVHISNIRKKLEAVSAPFTLRFVRNAGYILEETK